MQPLAATGPAGVSREAVDATPCNALATCVYIYIYIYIYGVWPLGSTFSFICLSADPTEAPAGADHREPGPATAMARRPSVPGRAGIYYDII